MATATLTRKDTDSKDGARKKALDAAISQITKDHGKGSIMRLGEKGSCIDVASISTGIIGLDVILGVGGLPKGRIIEIFGPESGGKTTLCLHALAALQRNGGTAAFIDAEHALDPVYAGNLGVKLDNLLVAQPNCGEEALEITDTLIRSGAIDMVVIDSVAALVPKVELEGEMGQSHVGLQARLMSQALRKLTASVSRSGAICIFINQLREKIGVMFGNPETTPGGRALKFFSSVRIEVRGGQITKKNGNEIVGRQMKVKVVKNKVAPPFTSAIFEMKYGEGISREASLIDVAIEKEVLVTKGTWISWGDDSIGQGREKASEWLKDNPEKRAELWKLVTEKLRAEREPKPEAAPQEGSAEKLPQTTAQNDAQKNQPAASSAKKAA